MRKVSQNVDKLARAQEKEGTDDIMSMMDSTTVAIEEQIMRQIEMREGTRSHA